MGKVNFKDKKRDIGYFLAYLDDIRQISGVHYELCFNQGTGWYLNMWRNADQGEAFLYSFQDEELYKVLKKAYENLHQYMEKFVCLKKEKHLKN